MKWKLDKYCYFFLHFLIVFLRKRLRNSLKTNKLSEHS